jgi:hypothetical protein
MVRTTVGTAVRPAALATVELRVPARDRHVPSARLLFGRLAARSARADRASGRREARQLSMPLSAWVPRLRGMSSH